MCDKNDLSTIILVIVEFMAWIENFVRYTHLWELRYKYLGPKNNSDCGTNYKIPDKKYLKTNVRVESDWGRRFSVKKNIS